MEIPQFFYSTEAASHQGNSLGPCLFPLINRDDFLKDLLICVNQENKVRQPGNNVSFTAAYLKQSAMHFTWNMQQAIHPSHVKKREKSKQQTSSLDFSLHQTRHMVDQSPVGIGIFNTAKKSSVHGLLCPDCPILRDRTFFLSSAGCQLTPWSMRIKQLL